jgi:Tfp pilus assembly protein PilN
VKPANLARRPFRNERLPNLLFALAGVAVLALTVRHGLIIRALMPGQTSALHAEVTQLEKKSQRLRAEQAGLRDLAPDPRALARWVLVKDLVDRRAFSWTGLFARLEALLPEGARLVSVAPSVHHGEI